MTCFRAEPVRLLPVARRPVCLNCQREFVADALIVTLFVEDEPIGFVCGNCVSSDARELLRSRGLLQK